MQKSCEYGIAAGFPPMQSPSNFPFLKRTTGLYKPELQKSNWDIEGSFRHINNAPSKPIKHQSVHWLIQTVPIESMDF